MKIVLKVVSGGFGNRFGPIISLYRVCRKYNIEFLILWSRGKIRLEDGKIVSFDSRFEDLFNNEYTKLIDTNTFNQITNNNKTYFWSYTGIARPTLINDKYTGYGIIDLDLFNTFDTIVISDCPHLMGLPTDPMNKWIPYSKKMGVYYQDDFIKELKYYFKEFVINDNILNMVNEILPNFSENMLGVQIRGDDRGGLKKEKSGTYDLLLDKIGKFLIKEGSKVFLTTLHKDIQQEIINKFPNKIITNDTLSNDSFYKHRDGTDGLIIAISNLLLLSKCNYIIGTAGSSYSFMSFIFGDCDTYETLLGYPNFK